MRLSGLLVTLLSLDSDDDEKNEEDDVSVVMEAAREEAGWMTGLFGEEPLLMLIAGVAERDDDANPTRGEAEEEIGAGEAVLPAPPPPVSIIMSLCLRS